MADTEHYVREDVQGFLSVLEQMGGPQLDEVPLAEARGSYVAMGSLAEADARDLAVIHDLTCPGPAAEIPLRLYDAREHREPGPVVMFFHGGGFVIGDLDTHHAFCTELAYALDLPVVAVHYRLAPEAPFPAAPDDCEAATRWVASNPAALGRQVTGLITTGDSAGGNLAIVTTQSLLDKPAEVPVIVQAPIYPVASAIENTKSYHSFGEGFLLTARTMGFFSDNYAADPNDKRNYPILHEDHGATPPTVLITAGLDPLRDSGREYAAHLIQSGVDVIYIEAKGNVHGFVNLRKAVPSAQSDVDALVGAIKLMLERHS
jgi:acetyl esterase